MATEDAFFLIHHVEEGVHSWLVVGDTLGIAAFDDATQFVGDADGFLFYHFVVADDIEFYAIGYYGL